ncbi:MLP-like protein 31 [Silene latifolia]|uniref:MLP-like protein 31 n=1 Tax=Silene latifolia TaxID=37657 RepID=UPI003D771D85
MGVIGKLEVEVDIKSSGDVFHELFKTNPNHVCNIVPDQIHACDVHEGEFGQIGSIIQWDYTFDGKKCLTKEVIEAIDEEKKMVKFRVIEGDLLTDYKNMSIAVHVIPKGDIDAVLWEIEFERFDDYGPYPTKFMDFLIALTRDVEAHHLNA